MSYDEIFDLCSANYEVLRQEKRYASYFAGTQEQVLILHLSKT